MQKLANQDIELIIAALGHFKNALHEGMDTKNLKRELNIKRLGPYSVEQVTDKFIRVCSQNNVRSRTVEREHAATT